MGETLTANLPPEQMALIQALDRDRSAMLTMMRQAILDGIRLAQLPRPVRSAKAGQTVTSQLTEAYPFDIPDDFISGRPSLTSTPQSIFAPTEPRMVLSMLIGTSASSDVWLGTRDDLSVANEFQPHRILCNVGLGGIIWFPVGRGIPVSEQKPLFAATSIALNVHMTLFHGPVRE